MIKIKKSLIVTFALITIIFISSFALTTFNLDIKANKHIKNKYFKSIEIKAGDSLWSIASDYISDEYDGIEDYIKELREMNGIKGNRIHAGEYISVAYYSDKKKKKREEKQ